MATATRPQAAKQWLDSITTTGRKLPGRYVLHGPESVGKTSFGTYAPKPIVLQSLGETGLETLMDMGRVPAVPHLPELTDWRDVLAVLGELAESDHDYKTLVIDTLNGVERLCHEHICRVEFGGDWGEKGFAGYQRGFEVSLAQWGILLNKLDTLRTERGMSILCLAHTRVAPYVNPEGPDYDRYTPDVHKKTWGLTHRWADAVLFLNFYTDVSKDRSGKAKGLGGQQRIIYTVRHAAYDAKNRHGLPEEISAGNSGKEAWTNFVTALREAKQNGSEQ